MTKTFSPVVLPRYTNPDLPVMMPYGITKLTQFKGLCPDMHKDVINLNEKGESE
jgi:hypothetical protein